MPQASDYLPRLKQHLLLDWDDPFLSGPLFVGREGAARQKLTRLVSRNSEDAVTWSVFRTLRRLPAHIWLPPLLGARPYAPPVGHTAIAGLHPGPDRAVAGEEVVSMELWPSVPPPASLLAWLLEHTDMLQTDAYPAGYVRQRLERAQAGRSGRREAIFEGPTEPDVVLTGAGFVAVIEARFTADVEPGTTWWPERDQIARCLDAALELAGPERAPYFVLITDDYVHTRPDVPPMAYETLLPGYRDDPAFREARLPHRTPEELARLDGHIGWLTWADLVDRVLDRSAGLSFEEKRLLRDLVDYLRPRRLLHRGG